MAVTKEEVRQLIDHLSPDQLEEVYTLIREMKEVEEQDEMSMKEADGLRDQEVYFESENSVNDEIAGKDLSRRDPL
ncbi:hypothetical protein ACFPU1_10500 [Thalassorhabdus alkalitolerans]|uniref:Uncharacterized protein n=1 Tax=Thalassorhabdus alkalitolerans TaxID=2282697 RepID=A0ABW0YP44_9BACI|nr:hypothetical protein [Thalassobacillus sp. C254]